MKKYPIILALSLIAGGSFISSCVDGDDNLEDYKEWRDANNAWLDECKNKVGADGEKYYTEIIPDYQRGNSVLMHWFNDREETKGNLVPFYTSTVDVKYRLTLYNGEPMDSSFLMTENGDSIYRTKLSDVITGWAIALQQMHVGDSVEVIVPYQVAYGTIGSGRINPYSNLNFHIKLVDIPAWEIDGE